MRASPGLINGASFAVLFRYANSYMVGTKILAWLNYIPEYGVVPHCKFGDKIVRGEFDYTVRIICISPPGEKLGYFIPFEVSLNGVDFTESHLKFSYYDVPTLYIIWPSLEPEAGGTLIYISGFNFTNMNNPVDFNCKILQLKFQSLQRKLLESISILSQSCEHPRGGLGKRNCSEVTSNLQRRRPLWQQFRLTFFSITRAFINKERRGNIIDTGQLQYLSQEKMSVQLLITCSFEVVHRGSFSLSV